MLTSRQKSSLLQLARQSIEQEFSNQNQTNKLKQKLQDKLYQEKRGVFVTLTKNKELRGCIGFPYPSLPLSQAIVQAAKSAAFEDPRFPPLQKSELNQIKIEISILTIPKQTTPDKIRIGKDGLIIQGGGHSGLLLPQVATEYNMNKKEFLKAICNKASLPKESYKSPDFQLFSFQAEIFSEN